MNIRAALDPLMKTLLEPVQISNAGEKLPQVGAIPRSLARAAGIPPTSTLTLHAPRVVPMLGSGTGGAGGIRLGGWE
jgi:hypothetical protein